MTCAVINAFSQWETRKDALATEFLDLVALPKKNKKQKARLAELKSLARKEVNAVPKRKRSAKEVRETPTDTKVKLKGKGFPVYKKENQFGDLIITYRITIPTKLTEKEKELFQELQKLR